MTAAQSARNRGQESNAMSGNVRCGKCSALNRPDAAYCSLCGARLDDEVTPEPARAIPDRASAASGHDPSEKASRLTSSAASATRCPTCGYVLNSPDRGCPWCAASAEPSSDQARAERTVATDTPRDQAHDQGTAATDAPPTGKEVLDRLFLPMLLGGVAGMVMAGAPNLLFYTFCLGVWLSWRSAESSTGKVVAVIVFIVFALTGYAMFTQTPRTAAVP